MKNNLFFLGIILVIIPFISYSQTEGDYELCKGKGEKCSVSVNGIPVTVFDSKGKDDAAVIIKF